HVVDQLLEHRLVHRVEAGERLIQDDQLRGVGDSGEHLHLLSHPLGQGLHRRLGEVQQAVGVKQLEGPAFGRAPVQTLERGKVADNGPDLHLLVEAFLFGQIANALAYLEGRGRAEDADSAGIRAEDVENHADGGGLAGAVRAEKTVYAATG